jgi:hypothetical protein
MEKLTEGVYFGSQAGVYNLLYVVQLAVKLGFKLSAEDSALLQANKKELTLGEEFIWLFEECEQYLDSLCEEGFTFTSYDGDYGVYSLESLENAY